MNTAEALSLLPEVVAVVAEASGIVRAANRLPKDVRKKGRIDLVTRTDLASEALLKKRLAALLPQASFLAEESVSSLEPGPLCWIIDPLDGTTNFAHGVPFVAISVALWQAGRVVLGVVDLPLLAETFTAVRGAGAFCNNEPIHVSEAARLEESLVATGFPYAIERHVDEILAHLRQMLTRTQGVRRPGAAALDLAYVATGRYDGFYELALKPWDTAAGVLLIEEAGGRVSEFDAQKPYTFGSGCILATNGKIHEEMSGVLGGRKREG
jgi:myo-inositol-1(or 4)-monophosphatase